MDPTEMRQDLAVLSSRVDRTESDISSLTLELRSLRDRVDTNHGQVMVKLETLQNTWLVQFQAHTNQDAIKDDQILDRINEQVNAVASLKSWLLGIGACAVVIYPVVSALIEFGILVVPK